MRHGAVGSHRRREDRQMAAPQGRFGLGQVIEYITDYKLSFPCFIARVAPIRSAVYSAPPSTLFSPPYEMPLESTSKRASFLLYFK